ncbi:MAG: hypothetical protein Q7T55_13775 [Solirubrobacteraceae bacterium]|nr:hypothetical protein [Solirubrobacteraceae bacterium]
MLYVIAAAGFWFSALARIADDDPGWFGIAIALFSAVCFTYLAAVAFRDLRRGDA